MIQGTASGVGKSWVCAGLCRLYARRGLSVAPFKSWNMSNNAAPAEAPWGWGEIGRAQAVQARACGRTPHVDMNPVLVKPEHDGAQWIIGGRPGRPEDAREAVHAAWARLRETAELVIVEGAGSPAEINLPTDLANMETARLTDAAVWIVGDIERGGVFASLLGTLEWLAPEDRARVTGLVINRFRGDPAVLASGIARLEARGGVPVRGVLPWRADIAVEDEDAVDLSSRGGAVDICVLRLPTVSNTTDLDGLPARWEQDPARVGNPDLLVLPGSKDTLADLAWLRARGLDRVVTAAAARGVPVLGLCGGYQLLGERLDDARGLGLLPVRTQFAAEKRVTPVSTRTTGRWLLPAGLPVDGYEIHTGRTSPHEPLLDGDGAVVGLVAGTYVHGLFTNAPLRDALIAALRVRRGLDPVATREGPGLEELADVMEGALGLTETSTSPTSRRSSGPRERPGARRPRSRRGRGRAGRR